MIVRLYDNDHGYAEYRGVQKIDFEDGSKWVHLMFEDGAGKIIRTKEYDRIEYIQDDGEEYAEGET